MYRLFIDWSLRCCSVESRTSEDQLPWTTTPSSFRSGYLHNIPS